MADEPPKVETPNMKEADESKTAFFPKHDRLSIPSASPFKKKNLTESLVSDVSMDISDITLEIEKINQRREDPEKGMKDTNRLLKEIDQQMEQSFEIMEERQNKVRSFLKEREMAEMNHRRRANQLMDQFRGKMSEMEMTLEIDQIRAKKNKTSVTQTCIIETNDQELQTSSAELNTNDLQEAVEALTHDMKIVVQKQLAREKVVMLQNLESRKNKLDNAEIENMLCELDKQLRIDEAKNLIKQLVQTETESRVKERLLLRANDLVDWLIQDGGDEVLEGLDDIIREKLHETKEIFQKRCHIKPKQREINSDEHFSDLREACRKIDLLEASLDSVLNDIQSNLDITKTELEQLSKNVRNEKDKGARNKLIGNFVNEKCDIETQMNSEAMQKIVGEFVGIQEELVCAEEVCNNILSLNFVHSNDHLLKEKMLKVTIRNKTLVKEKEDLLEMLNPVNNNVEFVITPTTNFYVEPIRMDEEEEESIEDLLQIEPKIGSKLVQDLLQIDEKSQTQAIDLVRYQGKSLDCIVKEYEQEIKELSDHQNEALAYEEVESIIGGGHIITDETVAVLKEEHDKVEAQLQKSVQQMEEVRENLKTLKQQKDQLLIAEAGLIKRKSVLKRELKEVNKHVADKLMNEQRQKEKANTEERIVQVTKEIEDVRFKMVDSAKEQQQRYEKKLQELAYDTESSKNIPLSKKLFHLKEDIEKLSPFVNKQSSKYFIDDVLLKAPDSSQVAKVIETKKELSKKLIETENRIQDIITSNDYESSPSGSLEQIEELQNDQVNVIDKNVRKNSVNNDLNTKLVEIELELDQVNIEMKDGNISMNDLHSLKRSSEELKYALDDIEKNLKTNPKNEKLSQKIEELKNEIMSLQTRLDEKEADSVAYSSEDLENLENAKAQLEKDLREIRDGMVVDKNSEAVIEVMKELLEERDRTQRLIMCLEEDVKMLNDSKLKMNGRSSINESLKDTEKELLDQKAIGISTIIQIARERLKLYIDMVKKKMEKKLHEAKEKSWVNKEILTKNEKQKLGKELKDIIGDINQTQGKIKEIEEFKMTGFAPIEDQSLLTTLSKKKNELLSNLDRIHAAIENDVSSEQDNLKELLQQKIETKQELMDLDERIDGQGHVLKERLKKLLDIKHILENKMADSVSIDDLQTIISELDKKDNSTRSIKDGEATVTALIKERISLNKNILRATRDTVRDKFEANEMHKVLESVDADIFARVEKIMSKLNGIDVEEDDAENFSFHLLANTATTFELQNAKNEFENALKLSGWQLTEKQVTEDDLKDTFIKIKEKEEFRKILENFSSRNIDLNNIDDINELKSLNEDKLDRLLQKIKKLNLLMDHKNKLDDQDKGGVSIDCEKLARAGVDISNELGNVVKSYSEETKNNNDIIERKPYVIVTPVKLDRLSSFLESRDEKLNDLFLLEKELESLHMSAEKRDKIEKKKEQLEIIIEEIDEKIIAGDFHVPYEEEEQLGSPTRSFSPRSTSSRNSFSVIIDERDQLLKKIFYLQKKEDFLRESEDILNKYEDIKEIQESKEKEKQNLKKIDNRILRCAENTGDDTLVEESDTIQHITEEDIKRSKDTLTQESKIAISKQNPTVKENDAIDLTEFITKPSELEIFLKIESIAEKMEVAKEQMKLHSLQVEKATIQETLYVDCSNEQKMVQEEIDRMKNLLQGVEKKIDLIKHREKLEKEMENLKEKIEKKDEKESEDEEHQKFLLAEHVVTKSELKKTKIDLERKLDDLNVLINQYSNALEQEVAKKEAEVEEEEDQLDCVTEANERCDVVSDENLNALLSHKRDLQQHLTKFNDSATEEGGDVSLVELLGKRRETIKQIEDVNKKILEQNIKEKKEYVTENIKKYYEECKKRTEEEKFNRHKKILLDRKIKKFEETRKSNSNGDYKSSTPDYSSLKALLGENLFQVLHLPKTDPEEQHLKELMMCLEDRTVSQYIKDMVGLCTIQNEQIKDLKKDINFLNDNDTNEKQKVEDFTEQIGNLQNELMERQKKMEEIERRKTQVRELIGRNLCDFITGDKVEENINDVTNPWFEDVRKKLRNVETVEQLLINNVQALEKEHNNVNLIEQLVEDKKVLQQRLNEREEYCEQLKRREEDIFSETESLRDNLQQCTRKTSSIHEEAQRLKNDYENAKEKLDEVCAENDRLKARVAKKEIGVPNLNGAVNKLKLELKQSNEEKGKLKISKAQVQNELEIFRKKFKRLSREKSLLQEKHDQERKNIEFIQTELGTSQQKEKNSKSEMHKSCQLIEKQEREIKRIKENTVQLEKQNTDLQNTVDELKEKYQTLNTKHQNEAIKMTKELRITKNKVEEHKTEIEKFKNENEVSRNDELAQTKIAFASERTKYVNKIKDLNEKFDETAKKNIEEVEELWKKIKKIEQDNEELDIENKTLLEKLHDLDESFEAELLETRKELNEKYNKSIDKLNEKIRNLAQDVIVIEQLKNEIEIEKNKKQDANDELSIQLREQIAIADEKEKTSKVKLSTMHAQLEGLKLENNELQDEIVELKGQQKKWRNMENYEKELKENLQKSIGQFEQEKSQFEENMKFFMTKSASEKDKTARDNKKLEDRVSSKLLKMSQDERDKMSEDVVNLNRELLHTRNELRKVKTQLRQKEQDYLVDEKQIISSIEARYKQKLNELQIHHNNDKEVMMNSYTEELSKWEDEIRRLKDDLQEESLKKLNEQRQDYEAEIRQQIEQCIKMNESEKEELQEQIDVSRNEKKELIKQFENERLIMKKKYDCERHALEETIRRLLTNLMRYKEQRNKLKTSHQDEINELEERFDAEKERLEERREEEIQILKENLHRLYGNNMKNERHILHVTFDDVINESNTNKIFGGGRLLNTYRNAEEKLTLDELRELVHMKDLNDIIDGEHEDEKEIIKQSMREQYKIRLRNETDALMKRLLELSDELDALKSNALANEQ